jgi:hypothetical protein
MYHEYVKLEAVATDRMEAGVRKSMQIIQVTVCVPSAGIVAANQEISDESDN